MSPFGALLGQNPFHSSRLVDQRHEHGLSLQMATSGHNVCSCILLLFRSPLTHQRPVRLSHRCHRRVRPDRAVRCRRREETSAPEASTFLVPCWAASRTRYAAVHSPKGRSYSGQQPTNTFHTVEPHIRQKRKKRKL